MSDGSSLDYNQSLTPTDPATPRPDNLWFYTNHDPMFYVGAMAANGYIPQAWRAMPMPRQFKPFIPPRPIPPYIGIPSAAGSFTGQLASEF